MVSKRLLVEAVAVVLVFLVGFSVAQIVDHLSVPNNFSVSDKPFVTLTLGTIVNAKTPITSVSWGNVYAGMNKSSRDAEGVDFVLNNSGNAGCWVAWNCSSLPFGVSLSAFALYNGFQSWQANDFTKVYASAHGVSCEFYFVLKTLNSTSTGSYDFTIDFWASP
jgi:hypothetical protein